MEREDGADVRVLELDRTLRSPNDTSKSVVVGGFRVGKSGKLLAQHVEVVADRRLYFVARPTCGHYACLVSLLCLRASHSSVDSSPRSIARNVLRRVLVSSVQFAEVVCAGNLRVSWIDNKIHIAELHGELASVVIQRDVRSALDDIAQAALVNGFHEISFRLDAQTIAFETRGLQSPEHSHSNLFSASHRSSL